MMFAQHVNDRIEDVLSPSSLEWSVMIKIMRSGRVWSRLSSLCNSLLNEMPAWDGDTPAKRLQMFQDHRNLDELNLALRVLLFFDQSMLCHHIHMYLSVKWYNRQCMITVKS
jgi:hypothetical protein